MQEMLSVSGNHRYDFECEIVVPNSDEVYNPFGFRQSGNKSYEGIYQGVYYTIMPEYGLVAQTALSGTSIKVYVKEKRIGRKSFYLLRSVIRKHIMRLIFLSGDVPLHAASVYNKNKNSCILITGISGAGKSTMTWAFLNQAFSLLSDDICVIRGENGFVCGEGGRLYVRPDFIKRYSVEKFMYRVVSQGRKIEVNVQPRFRRYAE